MNSSRGKEKQKNLFSSSVIVKFLKLKYS